MLSTQSTFTTQSVFTTPSEKKICFSIKMFLKCDNEMCQERHQLTQEEQLELTRVWIKNTGQYHFSFIRLIQKFPHLEDYITSLMGESDKVKMLISYYRDNKFDDLYFYNNGLVIDITFEYKDSNPDFDSSKVHSLTLPRISKDIVKFDSHYNVYNLEKFVDENVNIVKAVIRELPRYTFPREQMVEVDNSEIYEYFFKSTE